MPAIGLLQEERTNMARIKWDFYYSVVTSLSNRVLIKRTEAQIHLESTISQ